MNTYYHEQTIIHQYIYIIIYRNLFMASENEELVKITSGGTISIPKMFRKYLEMQKGDYVKMVLEGDHIVIRKVTIS